MSFAGLKTAVLKIAKNIKEEDDKYDLAASFQRTIEKIIYKKSKVALEQYKKISKSNNKFVIVTQSFSFNVGGLFLNCFIHAS